MRNFSIAAVVLLFTLTVAAARDVNLPDNQRAPESVPRTLPATFTHATVAVAASGTASYTIPAGTRYVDIQNTGTGVVRYTLDGSAATATTGRVLGAAAVSPGQGGVMTYETTGVPFGTISFYGVAASSVVVTTAK